MHAYATQMSGRCGHTSGRCGRAYVYDLKALLHAMLGGGEGEGGGYGGRRGRGYGHGRGWFGGYGPSGWPPPRSGGYWRGRKARRGDIRTAALLLLAEEPRNGYQIMQEVEHRSDGVWRPSPGSVYPALQQLEDEGLIRSEEVEGRKRFNLTDGGRAEVQRRDPDAPAPWEQMSSDFGEKAFELGDAARAVAAAFVQVMRTGDDTQMEQARKVLRDARRDLYRILADGEEGDPGRGADAKRGSAGDDRAVDEE
jgi:DNA-binding PadR family transcriptional regulator